MTEGRNRYASRAGLTPSSAGIWLTLSVLIVAACAAPRPEPSAEAATPASAPQTDDPAVSGTDEPDAARGPVDAAAPPRRRPPQRRITIAAVGDMMLGTDYPEDRLPADDGAGFLRQLGPALSAADLAFGNLEGVLADLASPVKECTNLNACFLFRSPTRYADHLKAAGFDGLSLANNHALDFGEAGRSETMQALGQRGIAHSGREGDFATLRWQGLDIAFLAFAVTRQSNLLHDYSLAESIIATQAESHDLVIVSFHGGAEGDGSSRTPFAEEWYYSEPRGDVVRFARLAVEAGADLVFGHGPHVVRGIERYRERLIAYSLGNFATYYGISVSGLKGVAPVLVATLDQDGRFLEGRILSTVQARPGGPRPDPEHRAFELIKTLSVEDFRDPGIEFLDDGRILPAERHYLRPTGDGESPSEG